MKTLTILMFFLVSLVDTQFSSPRRIPLTPELVVEGGYRQYRTEKAFPEENGEEVIRENVTCDLSKSQIYKRIQTFIAMNGMVLKYSDSSKVIAYVKYDVGNELFVTPVGGFNRNSSKIEYYITFNIKDDGEYQLIASNFVLERRRLFSINVINAYPLFNYADVNFSPAETKGTPNYLQNNRINYLIYDRNSYVDLVIKERKYLRRMKERYSENIAEKDDRIDYEIELCNVELRSVTDFLDKIRNHIDRYDF